MTNKRPPQAWIDQQRTRIRRTLRGQITRLAELSGLRVTDVYCALLRLRPLSPRSARRLAWAHNVLHFTPPMDWIELVDVVDATHPLFAPLHPQAIARDNDRQLDAERGGVS
jgi:hypothetical protein